MAALLAVGTLAALPPVASADERPQAWHHEGTIDPAYGAFAVGSLHLFRVPLQAGDRVGILLAWEAPTADLDLLLIAPAAGCDIAQPDCLLGPEGPVHGATCPGEENAFGSTGTGVGPNQEGIRATVATTGTYDLWVFTALAAPVMPVAYTLDMGLSRATPQVEGPEVTTGFVGSPHCRFAGPLPVG